MSDTTTTTTPDTPTGKKDGMGFVRTSGLVVLIVGVAMLLGGAGAWVLVQNELADEKIVVSEDAAMLAGRDVTGPLTAYAQAEVIKKHSMEIAGGKTYAELPQDDPKRATVMNASFLRASLFTSVLAFGVSAIAMALGVVQILLGISMRRLARART